MTIAFTQEEFAEHTAPLERELTLHCYRFMGSLQDSEDMYQETLIKAWKRLASLQSEEKFRAWIYKIATNICLDQLKKQKRRGMPHLQFPAADPHSPFPPPINEPLWLEPFPDALLPFTSNQPEKSYLVNEDISLAFMTTIHLLPPQQRAALIFMDVLDWSAKDTAYALEISVSAANSLVYRARKKLKQQEGYPQDATSIVERKSAELLDQYIQAWENSDIDQLTSLLTQDAVFHMPPFPCWYQGRSAIQTMVSSFLFPPQSKGLWKLIPTRANTQPAYVLNQLNPETKTYTPFGVMVLDIHKGKIVEIASFLDPHLAAFFVQ